MTSPGGHLKVVKGVIPGQSHPATASSIPSSREPPYPYHCCLFLQTDSIHQQVVHILALSRFRFSSPVSKAWNI